jgi:hypothetical protein
MKYFHEPKQSYRRLVFMNTNKIDDDIIDHLPDFTD